MPFLIVGVALLGLLVGPILTVLVQRAPRAVSLLRPAPFPDRINASVLVLAPVVAALFVAMAWRLSAIDRLPALPAYLYLVAVGVTLALIDIDCKRLPNSLVLSSYPVLLVLLGGAAAVQHDGAAAVRTLVGLVAMFGLYLVLALIYPAGMGFGDVKLAGVLGAVLGYLSYGVLLFGVFAGFLLASVVGLLFIISRRGTRKSSIPFGPYMIAGALVAILVGEPLARGYLRWVAGTG